MVKAKTSEAAAERAPRRPAGVRSNVFLTPGQSARIERVRDAQNKLLGMRPSSAAVQHQAINLGIEQLEQRLGLPPLPGDPDDVQKPTRKGDPA